MPSETEDRYPGFSSFKTIAPIHYPKRWLRNALIQATLDPSIVTIEPAKTVVRTGVEFAFGTCDAEGSRCLVLVSEVVRTAAVPDGWDKVTLLGRAKLGIEPAASAARSVWAQKRFAVPIGDQYRVLEAVGQPGGATLDETLSTFQNGPFSLLQVLSLVANGYVHFDITQGIGPATRLTLGMLARERSAIGGQAIESVSPKLGAAGGQGTDHSS